MKTKILITTVFFLFYLSFNGQQVIHVPADQPNIQMAINAAMDYDIILVEQGIYYENINFMGKAITLASNYINEQDSAHIYNTIIDGNQSGSVVTLNSYEDTLSVLFGFTIRNGSGTIYPNLACAGAGINIDNAGGKIKHNIIKNNVIDSDLWAIGGGLLLQGPDGYWVVVEDNIFKNNTVVSHNDEANGAGVYIWSNTIFRNNKVHGNTVSSDASYAIAGGVSIDGTADNPPEIIVDNNIIRNNVCSSIYISHGGGLKIRSCYGIIKNNTIESNQVSSTNDCFGAGVLLVNTDTNLVCENNIIAFNTFDDEQGVGYGGGICLYLGNAVLQNNMIHNNYASHGGGIYHEYGEDGYSKIINNTLTENVAGISGGGIYISEAFSYVLNTIFWENEAPEDFEISAGPNEIEVNYCDISGGYSGTGVGNIDEDPEFVDPNDGDFHLDEYSPMIGMGIVSFGNCISPDYDFDREVRPNGGIDIGSDEWYPDTGVSEKLFSDNQNQNLLKVSPNPIISSAVIEFPIQEKGYTYLSLYNISGQEVQILLNGELKKGNHKIDWKVENLNEGLYFLKRITKDNSQTQKILIINK